MRPRLQWLLLALAAASAPALAQDPRERPLGPRDLAPSPSDESEASKALADAPRDPGRSHYFFGTSAYTLRAGEHSLSQQEILYTAYEHGVTDSLSVEAGAVLPMWLAPSYLNFAFGAKLGFALDDFWHVALLGEVMLLPLGPSIPKGPLAVAMGAVTMGTPNVHFTLAAGNTWGFLIAGAPYSPVVQFSGLCRIHPNVALVTDNVIFPLVNGLGFSSFPLAMANSGGVRLMTRNLAADLGLILWPAAGIPIPWASVSFTFGGPGDR